MILLEVHGGGKVDLVEVRVCKNGTTTGGGGCGAQDAVPTNIVDFVLLLRD